uniref:Pepsin-I3 domain-containing protein n=1 Tax=Ascaris lumbricoides TaxID=6252 RepID=A0A0M3IGX3_ASCLU
MLARCQLIPGLPALPGLPTLPGLPGLPPLPGQPILQNLPTLCVIFGERIYVNGIDKGVATFEQKQEYENYMKKLFTWPHEIFLNSLNSLLQNRVGLFPFLGANTQPPLLSQTNNLFPIPPQPSFCKL